MGNNKFSIVIVLYNSSHHLPRLLANINSVLPMVDDIILVDNSNEDMGSIFSNYVRVIKPDKNLGYGGGINCGIQAAINDDLILANPDIHFEKFDFSPDVMQNDRYIVSGRTKNLNRIPVFPRPGLDVVRIGLCNIGWPFNYLRPLFPKQILNNVDKFTHVDWTPGCLIVTNKMTMRELGGFDEKYFLFYEEVDLCHRASKVGVNVGIVDSIKYKNFYGASSLTDVSDIKMKAEVDSFLRYHFKFNPGRWTFCCVIILKLWCKLLSFLLNIAGKFVMNDKIQKKYRQYCLYSNAIDIKNSTNIQL